MVQVKKRSEKGNVIIRADQIGDRCYTGKSWNKTEEKNRWGYYSLYGKI